MPDNAYKLRPGHQPPQKDVPRWPLTEGRKEAEVPQKIAKGPAGPTFVGKVAKGTNVPKGGSPSGGKGIMKGKGGK